MKLSVSSWSPYQYQADALLQFLGRPSWRRVDLATEAHGLLSPAFGPFLALTEMDGDPIVGVPAIVEAMHRREPERRLLPEDPVARSLSRALGGRIEECITRLGIAAIAGHRDFGRPIWLDASTAPAVILDDFAMRVAILDDFHGRGGMRFLAAEHASLADTLMAALWWTAEDQALDHVLEERPNLRRWHDANCRGAPFGRAPSGTPADLRDGR